ncbi:mitochondrial import inner membrane translocase subunit TIM10 [Annulohypoxylon truncatum]|uniref:mitochondrial import inner membrane translocase subunit TIM10 n=1 Tax=Annulohypoxylon truncatum TaxID=327061 RepID=UPI0020075BAF|nr:mitochondrial import inner membrane translocase subunit TIM10 [Annulohypoxylon truncatum]KAI1205409.1 mitochondrial import inner membrane translocase subunit TIM10 [Annulohypoxylon truncatum]
MSFLGFGRPQPSSEEKISAVQAEMKLLTQMHDRLTKACAKKCVPNEYRESELNKGESVCLDRCAAKFFDVHMKVSELLQQEMQQKGMGGGGGSGFGFGG